MKKRGRGKREREREREIGYARARVPFVYPARWMQIVNTLNCFEQLAHCNTLQHAAAHCNTLQHAAAHCNTLQHTATLCNTLQRTTTQRCINTQGNTSQLSVDSDSYVVFTYVYTYMYIYTYISTYIYISIYMYIYITNLNSQLTRILRIRHICKIN